MLFVHHAPRSSEQPRYGVTRAGTPTLRDRRRSATPTQGRPRPSSAARTDRRSGSERARPGSAGRYGARTPPTSARSTGVPGAAALAAALHAGAYGSRPGTPGRLPAPRDARQAVSRTSTSSSLPANRPRTPTGRRPEVQPEPQAPEQAPGSQPTVISSALDYKRFLDRRKLMIQQQVESAQQANGVRGEGLDRQGSDGSVPEEAPTASREMPLGMSRNRRQGPQVPGRVMSSERAAQVAVSAAAGQIAASTSEIAAPLPTSDSVDNVSLGAGEEMPAPESGCSGQRRGHNWQPQQAPRSSTPGPTQQRHNWTPGGETGDVHSRASSLPAGNAAKACRSLNRGELQETLQTSNVAPESGTEEAQRPKAPSSTDGLLRDSESMRGSSITGSALEDYVIGKQIGQGAYAVVYFGMHKETGRKVAIKAYEKYKLLDPQRRKSVRCEIRIMERMRHPNVVIFHDALDTPKQIYIVMDFVGGGSLHQFLKKRPGRRLEDSVAKRIIFQVAHGIKYLHDRHIVHRDIKLENLLLDESGTVKIIDFGFSTIVPPGKKLKVFCGTPSYMAPEIVARKEYSGFCADIWAMGVLLFALLNGSFPFKGQNDRDLYRKIVRGAFHVPDQVSDEARRLLGRILTVDMSLRPTVDDALGDAWFSAHRDDLYSAAKPGSHHPNTSTSSTATTAVPSSSLGGATPSARDAGVNGAAWSSNSGMGSNSLCSGAATRTRHPAPLPQVPSSSTATSATSGTLGGQALVSAPLRVEEVSELPGSGDASQTATRPASAAVSNGGAEESVQRAPGRRVEEEAICKLERLGYQRDEIVRQLQDENSHLCKLYHRFLKALTAWDSKS